MIALKCLERFPGEVAVALLDQSCCGFQGYQQLQSDLKRRQLRKKVLVLDCVTSGEELHLHRVETAPELEGVQNHKLSVQEERGSVLELFPDCMILTGGRRAGDETVVLDTRSGKDRQIRLEKMEQTVEIVHQLVEFQHGTTES